MKIDSDVLALSSMPIQADVSPVLLRQRLEVAEAAGMTAAANAIRAEIVRTT